MPLGQFLPTFFSLLPLSAPNSPYWGRWCKTGVSAVATLGAVIGGGAWARVWQTGAHGYGTTPVVEPHANLAGLVDLATHEAGHPVHRVLPKRRWAWPTSGGWRATPPAPGDALGTGVALRLTVAEKRMLDLLAAWPLCTTAQLANLMGGLSERRANQLLRPLRRLGLARREGEAHVLTDEGLTYLARRDRAAVGPMLDRWSAERTEAGVYAGTALRALASQRDHQRGLAEFVSLLALEARYSPDHELLDLLPTHVPGCPIRTQLCATHGKRHCRRETGNASGLGRIGFCRFCTSGPGRSRRGAPV